MTTTASVIDVISIADLVSPTSTLTVTPAAAAGATSFSGLTGRWALSQVDNTGATGTFLRADGTWATVSAVAAFSDLTGTLAFSQRPAGGSSSTFFRGDGTWATVPGVTATQTVNTTTGNVALAQNAWRVVVHKATGATNYQLPTASLADQDVVDIIRDSAGTGTIAIDGGSINVVRGATSALTWGPSSRLNAIRATYFATGNVWRLS